MKNYTVKNVRLHGTGLHGAGWVADVYADDRKIGMACDDANGAECSLLFSDRAALDQFVLDARTHPRIVAEVAAFAAKYPKCTLRVDTGHHAARMLVAYLVNDALFRPTHK